MQEMNTRKHLGIIFGLLYIIMVLGIIASIVCFIAMVDGAGALPFIICVVLTISCYLGMVFLSVIIDFYEAVVTKHQVETAILNAIAEDDKHNTNSKKR